MSSCGVKPDCSKASVQKALGMRRALLHILSQCTSSTEATTEKILQQQGLLLSNFKSLPKAVVENITTATAEFAGIKFKTTATSGRQYLLQIENSLIKNLQKQLPQLKRMIICEEKYHFTPDDFKAATRANRQKKFVSGISHLKVGENIISAHKLSKPAIRETATGKRLISSFLASNVQQLNLKNITLDIDSELLIEGCKCQEYKDNCSCQVYTRPKRAMFDSDGFTSECFLDIKQRKGEAEMSQVDWLQDVNLSDGDSIIGVVTSGDIDSVAIHLFAISQNWPRDEQGKYKNTVFILLQKPKPDLYNITGILELMEAHFQEPSIGAIISVALCLGGNDFLPKFHGVTHKKWIETIFNTPRCPSRLLEFIDGKLQIKEDMYMNLVKKIYCPLGLDADKLTLEDVRQLSIKVPGKNFRNPNSWMPPQTALQQIVKLINCQISYFYTIWDHSSTLPDFIATGCLIRQDGDVEYNLGSEVHCEEVVTLLKKTDQDMLSTIKIARKQRQKRPCPETPDKQARKRPLVSTPRRRKALIPVEHNIIEDLSDEK